MFTSYAQNFEDVMLYRALKQVERGSYVDIGAHDPNLDSVSKAFHTLGWKGVHVEPIESIARSLAAARPHDLVIEAAISATPGITTLYNIQDSGLSTTQSEIARQHKSSGLSVSEQSVIAITLDDVFSQLEATEVHWLKIDVEGSEADVIRSWVTAPVRPWIVVIESTLPLSSTPTFSAWEPELLDKGYRFAYEDGINRYYHLADRDDLAASFEHGPNVFDDFTVGEDTSFARMMKSQLSDAKTELKHTRALLDHERIKEKDDNIARLHAEIAELTQSLNNIHSSKSWILSKLIAGIVTGRK